jgi:hypothetical protein
MLQWHPKTTALVVLAALIVIAAVNGLSIWFSVNFTW